MSFPLLIKPASADCNLHCHYCFYLEKCQLYPQEGPHRMSDEVLEALLGSYLAIPMPVHSFTWQGGEPTLMGHAFFEKVTTLQARLGLQGSQISNGLMTNATLVTDTLARHLARYQFLVGVSLDGPQALHDRFRQDGKARGSFQAVQRGIGRLREAGVALNAVVLVSQANVRHAREVFHFLLDEGFSQQQYVPCVEFDPQGRLQPFAIRGEEWGTFLLELFAAWKPFGAGRVSIRHLDALLQRLVTGEGTLCTFGTDCQQYLVVEHNGDVYPCDFFVEPGWKLGNVLTHGWPEMLESARRAHFGQAKRAWPERCQSCPHLLLCGGDCLKHRRALDGGLGNLSHLCQGWQAFFNQTRPTLEAMARSYSAQLGRGGRLTPDLERQAIRPPEPKPQATPPQGSTSATAQASSNPPTPPASPHAPCPCGSGKKYKKCCGANG